MATIPHPSVEDLLPPFLAHIPIAFSSAQAPPSLLPLLAPILRSRVRLLSDFTSDSTTTTSLSSPSDSWLSLLTWSTSGAELCQFLSQQDFSPHPSGEFEIGEYTFIGMRRTDEETIKSRVELSERGIEVVYVWVDEKEDKDEGAGWKIVDVRLVKGIEEDGEWYPTVALAEEGFKKEREEQRKIQPVKDTQVATSPLRASAYLSPCYPPPAGDDEEEGDSYWDMYDRSPARTPAVQHQTHIQSEDEYFARYSNVQPALDCGEEEEKREAVHQESYPYQATSDTLSCPTYNATTTATTTSTTPPPPPSQQPQQSTFLPPIPLSPPTSSPSKPASIHSPRAELKTPPRRSGSPSASVSALEELASQQVQAETGVKQHISSTIKSLFRLARVTGMERGEFERVIRTELEVLGLMEEGESVGSW